MFLESEIGKGGVVVGEPIGVEV